MRQRLCQYANCQIDTTNVIVTDGAGGKPMERPAFCGRMHAALWLLDREGHRELARQIEEGLATGKRIGIVCVGA